MKHLLTSCAALALTAGLASAATIVELDSSGVYSTAFAEGSTLSLNGAATGDVYYDPAPVRDYTVTFSGILESMIPDTSIAFGGSFAWTGSLTALGTITPFPIGSTTSGFITSALGSGNFSSFATSGTSYSFDYAVELIGAIRDDFVAATGSYNGDYSIAATFTAAVPIPASLPLALSALGLLGFAARRRKGTATAA